jgi:hypothetical protein
MTSNDHIPWLTYDAVEGWIPCTHGHYILPPKKNTDMVWVDYDTDFCPDCGKPLNPDLSLLDSGGIIDRCPGCFTKIEGRREHVERLVAFHRTRCSDFYDWEQEQRLRVQLGKLT